MRSRCQLATVCLSLVLVGWFVDVTGLEVVGTEKWFEVRNKCYYVSLSLVYAVLTFDLGLRCGGRRRLRHVLRCAEGVPQAAGDAGNNRSH